MTRHIDKSIYEGYLWYSDRKEPVIFDSEEYQIKLDDESNPFIVEGNLYDADKKMSYSIKYVDGKYIICRYEVKDDDYNAPNQVKTFIPNRMPGIKYLKFIQYWKTENDEFCNDWDVLQPGSLVFVGFEK